MKTNQILPLLILLLTACNSQNPGAGQKASAGANPSPGAAAVGGPIDGDWKVTKTSCDGAAVAQMSSKVSLNIKTDTGTSQQEDSHRCIITTQLGVAYPSQGKVAFTNGTVTCNPLNCSPMCRGDDPEAAVWDYQVSGNTLQMAKYNSVGEDACALGQLTVLQLTK